MQTGKVSKSSGGFRGVWLQTHGAPFALCTGVLTYCQTRLHFGGRFRKMGCAKATALVGPSGLARDTDALRVVVVAVLVEVRHRALKWLRRSAPSRSWQVQSLRRQKHSPITLARSEDSRMRVELGS